MGLFSKNRIRTLWFWDLEVDAHIQRNLDEDTSGLLWQKPHKVRVCNEGVYLDGILIYKWRPRYFGFSEDVKSEHFHIVVNRDTDPSMAVGILAYKNKKMSLITLYEVPMQIWILSNY